VAHRGSFEQARRKFFPLRGGCLSLSLGCEQRGEQQNEQQKRNTGGVTDSRALKHQC